jgi:hypothetical protein
MSKVYYKTVRRNLKSWYGNLQYKVGKEISLPVVEETQLCTNTVLHASENPLDALKHALTLDCALLEVSGDEVIHGDHKSGFFSLSVIREIPDSEKDSMYGFSYNEAIHPINPCEITSELTEKDKENLKQWASVSDSVWAYARDLFYGSVEPFSSSVRVMVMNSVMDFAESLSNSILSSFRISFSGTLSKSIRNSVGDSISDSFWAYVSSLFPTMGSRYVYLARLNNTEVKYPFQSGVELWKRGFIPIRLNKKWNLYHPIKGKPAKLVWRGF